MSPRKSATTSAKTSARRGRKKQITVTLQLPGKLAEEIKVVDGTTVGDFMEQYNLESYTLNVSGKSAVKGSALKNGDVLRTAVKTKHG